MSARREVRYIIDCDECFEYFDWTLFDSLADALKTVAESGWTVITRNRILCPACNDRPA